MTESIYRVFIDALLAISSFYIHEYGHYFSGRILGLKCKLIMSKMMVWYNDINSDEHLITLMFGIILGLIPILFMSIIFLKYIVLIGYLFACSIDIIQVLKILLEYSKVDLPKFVFIIDKALTKLTHHKFCECSRCKQYSIDDMFFFRG